MLDRILALVAFLTLLGFLYILGSRVPRTELIVVLVITALLCAYDFYRILLRRSRKKPREAENNGA